jgi:hypothetical protein
MTHKRRSEEPRPSKTKTTASFKDEIIREPKTKTASVEDI